MCAARVLGAADEETTMAETMTTAATARAFTEAWTRGDSDAAGSYLADDVVFDGPLGHVEGKGPYLENLAGLRRSMGISGVRVAAAYGGDSQALIMYELDTDRFGGLLCAKLLTFRDGMIASDRLTFDSYVLRLEQGG
jgi:hypothetical protein